MTQVTAIDFKDLAQPQSVQVPMRGTGARLMRQMRSCAAMLACELQRWAERRSDQALPPADVSMQRFRRDVMRIEVRRLL
jgi:hypothetical protein